MVVRSRSRTVRRSFGFRADALAAVVGESALSFRQMFASAPVGILLADREGRIVESNSALQGLLGLGADELAGLPLIDLIHPADRVVDLSPARQRTGGRPGFFDGEARCLGREGSSVWTRIHVAPVTGPRSAEQLSIATIESIQEQKLLEERLLQTHKLEAMGRLAGGVAHDFNNLVMAIMGYSDVLLARRDLGAAARDDVAEIRRIADRAAELTRQLLLFGGRQSLQPQVLDLNGVMRGIESMLRRALPEQVELVTELEPELWPVRADSGQLESMILNLVLNARDAMPGGGKLVVATRNEDHEPPCVALSVADTGVGMDELTLARAFEPFFTTKEPGSGTGLGLATVYGVVEQSGGRVEVSSEPGQGTMFTVLLPSAATPRRGQREATPLVPGVACSAEPDHAV